MKHKKTTSTKKPRKKQPWQKNNTNTNFITLFSLTLAALKTPQNPLSKHIILNSSTKLLHLLHPNSPSSSESPLINPIISLLPPLLHCSCHTTLYTAVKIVGAVSLFSIEANERIASDAGILKGLVVNVLRVDVVKAVCNAVLDVCVTSLGCQRLIDVSGLNYILLGFLQVQRSMVSSLCINLIKNEGDIFLGVEHKQDETPVLLLNTVGTLINFCNSERLKNIPRRLKEVVLPLLGEIWSKVREQILASKILNFSKVNCSYLSNLTSKNLAESIFRLSMYAPVLPCSMPSEAVMGYIFGPSSSSFTNFMLRHWEFSPYLLRNQPKDLEVPQVNFSSFMHSLISEESLPKFLSSILQGMVSCPPVALNEIDGLSLLDDVRSTLGSPIIYQQDIRVVKTNVHSKFEEHYFQKSSSNGFETQKCFSADDILKCESAFREGYTIALRGMEFRFDSIAAITRDIASIFGQPSVGANLYVTPPSSQGLSCHYDDHCVFICQLYGAKKWTVFPQPIVKLPRLYECLEIPGDLLVESREIFLREGDVLYIPRGFAHEACTLTDLGPSSNICESSVHLTLAIEVEPPFEWEGFAHIALYQWSKRKGHDAFVRDTSEILVISVNILHVAIRLISNPEHVFRKACLVAASSLPTETENWLDMNQRATFNLVIDKINELSSFTDSIEFLQMAVERDDDPFHWLRWLEHLNGREEPQDFCNFTSDGIHNIVSFINQHKEDAEVAFAHVKSTFCNEVLFDDAKESFKHLHALYKEARMRYMNGMLSLHH